MRTLEEKLGYTFKNKALLENALQHSSYANEHRNAGTRSNERLEFLGDAVLGVVTADYLYRSFPDKPEGELTRSYFSLLEKSICRQAAFYLWTHNRWKRTHEEYNISYD